MSTENLFDFYIISSKYSLKNKAENYDYYNNFKIKIQNKMIFFWLSFSSNFIINIENGKDENGRVFGRTLIFPLLPCRSIPYVSNTGCSCMPNEIVWGGSWNHS